MSAAEKKSPISSNRWIFSYLLTEKKIFIPSLVALFLTAGLALAFPYFLKELIGNPVDSVRNAVPPAEIISKINDIILTSPVGKRCALKNGWISARAKSNLISKALCVNSSFLFQLPGEQSFKKRFGESCG